MWLRTKQWWYCKYKLVEILPWIPSVQIRYGCIGCCIYEPFTLTSKTLEIISLDQDQITAFRVNVYWININKKIAKSRSESFVKIIIITQYKHRTAIVVFGSSMDVLIPGPNPYLNEFWFIFIVVVLLL